MANDENIGKGLLLGFLAGGILGSALALLYAPKSGRELRGDIRVKSDEFVDDAEKYLEKVKNKADALINEGRKKSDKMVADAKEKVDSLLKEAEKILTDAKSKTDDFVEEGKGKIGKEGDKLKSAVKAGIKTYKTEKESKS